MLKLLRAGAHVMAYHGFRVLDVFPASAVGEPLLKDKDIRHFTDPMYHVWAQLLVGLLCGIT